MMRFRPGIRKTRPMKMFASREYQLNKALEQLPGKEYYELCFFGTPPK